MNLNKLILSLLIFLNAGLLLAQETVVFSTDRDTYIAGESVWINASCLKSGTNDVSQLSKVIYAEVLNAENVPVIQIKLNPENGSVSTAFEIPADLNTGNYQIRAYTKWMRNYNPDFFFTKNIAIINPFTAGSFPEKENAYLSDTLFFFPEGGKLIRNCNNKILVLSVDKFGNPKSVSGEIITPTGKSVLKIETPENGFAIFNLNPQKSGLYLYRSSIDTKKYIVPVGEVLTNRINLQLRKKNNNLIFQLATDENLNASFSEGEIHLISQSGDFIESFPLVLKKYEAVSIDPKEIPSGYLCALLIDANNTVLSSRYFSNSENNTAEGLNIKTDKEFYTSRTPVLLSIENFSDLKSVSVSVVKSCLLNDKTKIGKIARPGVLPKQLITEQEKNGIEENDLLLCFTPFDTVKTGGVDYAFLPEIKGEIISGNIVNPDDQLPIINESFMLNFVGKHPTMNISKTDSLGRFYFESKRFGEQEIVIQPYKRDTSVLNYKVNLDLAFSTQYSKHKIHPLFIETKNMEKINRAIVNMQVNALYKSYQSFSMLEKAEPEPDCFYGEPEISIKTQDFIELPNMEEVFREIVPNTQLVKKDEKFSIKVSEGDLKYGSGGDSFCMVDGVPIQNQNNIFLMQPKDVEKIDVMNLDFFIREYKISNLVNVTTSRGDMSAFDFDTRLFRQSYNGYFPTYFFNSPDYSVDSLRNSRIPDFRNLLYWNPKVDVNDQKETQVSFYTSDETGVYTIVVEAINHDGILERKQIPLLVKE